MPFMRTATVALLLCASATLCAATAAEPQVKTSSPQASEPAETITATQIALLNRLTWGATRDSALHLRKVGNNRFLREQLQPGPAELPPAVQETIDAMEVSAVPADELVSLLHQQQQEMNKAPAGEEREALRKIYQTRLGLLSRQARQRSLLRSLHSPRQLQEKMTWFWMNHFNVYAEKNAYTRPLMVDLEEKAIRPHALGNFRDLLAASMHHPAMLLYLDNNQNSAGKQNENYARELLELHTLGPHGGYRQEDVAALARILTGLGVNVTDKPPRLPEKRRIQYVRDGVFEFNSARHDDTEKQFLGTAFQGDGLAEIDKLIDMLASHPATATHVSRKLATYFMKDDPPDPLIAQMSTAFSKGKGDIAATLLVLFESMAFKKSLGDESFKDPMQYVLSATRLMHGTGDAIINAQPIVNWLNLLGQGLYSRQTPDGYPLQRSEWQGSGQMMARFDVARSLAGGMPQFHQAPESKDKPPGRPAPETARELYQGLLRHGISESTRQALQQAKSPHEWNTLLLASPDFMTR